MGRFTSTSPGAGDQRRYQSGAKTYSVFAAIVLSWAALAYAADPDSPDALLKEWRAGFLEVPGTKLRMHRLETTQEIYRLVVGVNPSRWTGEDHSVEMVTWDEAVAFCQKATALLRAQKLIAEAEEIRLPSEREWELACRAGTTTAYSFGDDLADLGDYGWFQGNAAGNDPPAGAKKPNPWGFCDFHGYVWEWCSDLLGDERAIRGGAWTSQAEECRSDSRQVVSREAKSADLGFRCVLAAAAGSAK